MPGVLKKTLIDNLEDIKKEVTRIEKAASTDDVRWGQIWKKFQKVCEESPVEVYEPNAFSMFLNVIKWVLLDYDNSPNEWQWVKNYLLDILKIKITCPDVHETDNGPFYTFDGRGHDDSNQWIVRYVVKRILKNWNELIWHELQFYRERNFERGDEHMEYIRDNKHLDHDQESVVQIYSCILFFSAGSNDSQDIFAIVRERILREKDAKGWEGRMYHMGTLVQIRDATL